MNLLFDISPDEVPDDAKKKPKQRKAARVAKPEEPQAGADPASEMVPVFRRRNDTIIGRSEGHYDCAYEKCGSTQFDILDEWRGEWLLECMICGTGQHVPAIPGVIEAPDEAGEFVFADGRYEGRSIREAAQEKNGQIYIRWASCNHKREAVRTACKKWIDASEPAP